METKDQRTARIYVTYHELLTAYSARFVGDIEVARDIVSEVFCGLLEDDKCLTAIESLRSYLYASVRNRSLDYLKHVQVLRKFVSEVSANIDSDDNTPLSMMISNEALNSIEHAIDCLPPECKKVFLLAKLEGFSYHEISRKLGISVNAVNNQITKAFRILREIFEKQGRESFL